jgi:chaperonin cofactor prefoldin
MSNPSPSPYALDAMARLNRMTPTDKLRQRVNQLEARIQTLEEQMKKTKESE